MDTEILQVFLFLLLGMLLGGSIGWLLLRARFLSRDAVTAHYVDQALFKALQDQADVLRADLAEKEEEIRALIQAISSKDQMILNLDDRLREQEKSLVEREKRMQTEFENLANRLLEEKSRKFTDQNHRQITSLLEPLRERIRTFEAGVEQRFLEETRDRVSLKKEIEQLRALNQQLSLDANNLASALKGDNKTQGDWGEVQLELLLQRAGLSREVHYRVQASFTDQNGKARRPDFIIHLPDDKHLVIDSKVSLAAYEQYCATDSDADRQLFLKQHLQSIRRHIKDLGSKNYQQLYQINSPDYLLLFVPIEPAFALAIQQDTQLFSEALDRNIVLVTTSTLLATMRTVSFIWKQEKQKHSVLEIARQSGLLYDKFCTFVEDLQSIGTRLDQAQGAYEDAMRKLVDSKKFGDTLVGRAERIRELGAQASKNLPKELTDKKK